MSHESETRRVRIVILVGRVYGWLALLALLAAWATNLLDRPILGMTQQHYFNDAIVLALLCVCNLLDGLIHMKLADGRKIRA